jgi:hypothetical protein
MDEHRRRNVEFIFQNVTDDELIDELIRRKRLTRFQAQQSYHVDFAGHSGYLDSLERDLCVAIAREANNKLAVSWDDHPVRCKDGLFHGTVVRVGHLDALVSVEAAQETEEVQVADRA